MKANIEIRDDRDAALLSIAILSAIHELVEERDKARKWGLSTMTTEDAIHRLQRMLKDFGE